MNEQEKRGAEIAKRRMAVGLSHAALAQRAGLSLATVCRLEAGAGGSAKSLTKVEAALEEAEAARPKGKAK